MRLGNLEGRGWAENALEEGGEKNNHHGEIARNNSFIRMIEVEDEVEDAAKEEQNRSDNDASELEILELFGHFVTFFEVLGYFVTIRKTF